MEYKKMYLAAMILLTTKSLWAAEYRCPETIQTTQTLYSQPEPDWKSRFDPTGGVQSLEGVSIIDGQDQEAIAISADPETEGKARTWSFGRKKVRAIWLCCSYGQTKIQVLREIPSSTRKCTLKLKPNSKQAEGLSCS